MGATLTIGRPAQKAGRRFGLLEPALGTVAFLAIFAALVYWNPLQPAPAAAPFEEVTLDLADGHPIRVGRYEVTYAMWRQCHADGACEILPKPGRHDADGQFPVTGINWLDANRFVAWINAKTGLGYRLPTLAEWHEIAGIEPGETGPKLFDDPRLAWAADYGANKPVSRKVRPSGHFGLAGSGVADIDGNVWEWTSTCVSDIDLARCAAYFAAGQDHIAEIPVFLRNAYGGGCSAGTPPANLGLRLVRD